MLHILNLVAYLIFSCLLIIAFVYDFRWGLIPDFVSYGIFILAFIRIPLFYFLFSTFYFLFNDFFLAFFVFILFFGLWFVSRGRAMGFGDVKLAPAIALFLGWPNGLLATLFSFWFGAIYGILLLAAKRGYSIKSEISFGPFLALGAMIALLWGNSLWQWYQNIIML